MAAVSAFMAGNYPHQPVAVYLFVKSVNLSFMLKSKSDVIKKVSYAKISHLFTVVEVLMKHTIFAFSLFLYLLMESIY